MRIGYIIQNLMHGGAETQLMAIALEQKRVGHDILVITLFEPEAYFLGLLEPMGVQVKSYNLSSLIKFPSVIFKIRRQLVTFHADIVHSHMYHSNMIARVISPTYKKAKYICTVHNIKEGGKFRDLAYRLTDNFCDLTTNVSQAAVDRYNKDGLVKNNRCLLVANGVDVERFCFDEPFRQSARKELQVEDGFCWLAVASLTAQKDFPNMLAAIVRVLKYNNKFKLCIAGAGPEEQAIRGQIEGLGLAKHVYLIGSRNDTERLYSMADGYIMSSAWEGLPIVLLEASSSSLPCVVTDVGGNSEIVLDSESGYVVPASNPELLCEKMLAVMAMSAEERKAMGEIGRQQIFNNYGLAATALQWLRIYNELL